MQIQEINYQKEIKKRTLDNKNLGLKVNPSKIESLDFSDLSSKFVKEYKELDIHSVFSLSFKERFEQLKTSVIKQHEKKFPIIQIAQYILCGLYAERNYINSFIEVLKISKLYKALLEDSCINQNPISKCLKTSYASEFSYEELSSLEPQATSFVLKYLYVVESKIKPRIITNPSMIEELKDYWKHENPTIATEAKKLYYHLSGIVLETKFYHTETFQFFLGNRFYALHFIDYAHLHPSDMPDFTPLILKNIMPIGTKVFADYNSLALSLNSYEEMHKNQFFFVNHLYKLTQEDTYNPLKKLVDSYLNIQSKQSDLYNDVYLIWLNQRKIMFKNKTPIQNFSQLGFWASENSTPNQTLPQSLETLIVEGITPTTSQVQKKTSSQKVKIIKKEKETNNTNKIKKQKYKNKYRTKKTENLKETTTSIAKPSALTITLKVRSQEEEEVHQLLLKSPFKKVFRISRWQNLTESIPNNEQFPEYVYLDEKNQVIQIKRHGFCSEVDRLLHDRRFTIKTTKGSHLLAHVQFDEQDKQTAEFSVISYAFNPEKKMYHRYIHSFGTQIFHSDLSKNIEKITILDSLKETENEEIKQKSSEGTEIQFDRRSCIFTFKDTIRGMTITVFPVPEPEDK